MSRESSHVKSNQVNESQVNESLICELRLTGESKFGWLRAVSAVENWPHRARGRAGSASLCAATRVIGIESEVTMAVAMNVIRFAQLSLVAPVTFRAFASIKI